uniref:Uncharacterized protein n=1 Tax=Heliothis virescens TaxID=7102 RepID=A0A2A4JVW1_HELVI
MSCSSKYAPLYNISVNLDSPTVSVTQVVPPWPKPRDKTNEPIEPDPDPEPTPPPTPPPVIPPEGGGEEEEVGEEEEDEETRKAKEEEAKRKAEEEEARRKAAEIPPPLPPPPPSPQPEPEVPLAPMQLAEDEVQTLPAVNVDRRVLLTEDAQYRSKLRRIRKKMTSPLMEDQHEGTLEEELQKPTNFKDLPDSSQIVRGTSTVSEPNGPETIDRLPFGAIMAIVTSYKYSINTWTPGIVNFVVETALRLYDNKQQKFQLAPVHIIPKIALGHQAYHANIDVVGEGASWQMEDVLARKFFNKYDRGMVTTASYSCAIFKRNGLYYLFDGSPCNAMGLRNDTISKGKACFLRFRTLHELVSRINYNKDGGTNDQQFILSRILVRRLLKEARHKLPEDHDFATGKPASSKSKQTIIGSEKDDEKRQLDVKEYKSQTSVGYQLVDGVYRIEGTTSLNQRKPSSDVKSCHFISLIAMLMAAMHPIRTWDHVMVDVCMEKGLEIHEKATNLNVCEKRVIKNVILDGKFININIKKIIVVNENPEKRLEQYLKAVLRRLRYVIIRYPQCSMLAPMQLAEDEVQTLPAVNVDRRVLLTEDAQYRSKLRRIRKKMTSPLMEDQHEGTLEEELQKPTNFKDLPDSSQIVRGTSTVSEPNGPETIDRLPFGAIMAIVTSYKYSINTWTPGIVNFVVETALRLYDNKQQKFQLAPVHIIPKIALGHQAYHANIDVVGEGASWQMEDVLARKFFNKYDRGMVTTASYSCAIFKRNGLYYLFDGSPCNAMGLRNDTISKGKACFLRFRTLHELVSRINYNKDGGTNDQQFILSRILVRRLLKEARHKLPEDHDFATGKPASSKSKQTIIGSEKDDEKRQLDVKEYKSQTSVGYQLVDGVYRIEGTTSLNQRKPSSDVKSCHFISLIAMLMAAMHPIRTWDHVMVDVCMEKGLEIHEKATNLNVCEKRVIKNVILDGKFININIKKIIVVNENPEKRLEQYLKAVLRRLRYVIIRYPQCSMVICQTEGYYHLFDPYPPPSEDVKEEDKKGVEKPSKKGSAVASWTLYRSMESLIRRIRKELPGKQADDPEFYTFELTSVKSAPRHSALNYRLSPLFRPDDNPNLPYLKRRKVRPIVDEKMYWLNIPSIPWSRMSAVNDLGLDRKTPKTMWKDWDIEFPGDLYSLWGTIHPLDKRFDEADRGKQYLATSVIAIGMTQVCDISAWTSGFIDGIVIGGNQYHKKLVAKVGTKPNHEIDLPDLESKFEDMYPFTFNFKFDNIIFGFVYNIYPDRFNLSKALTYFFEKETIGILISPTKNLAFGKLDSSYFMFDCQSFGAPIFSPGKGAAYMLKCESLNRLIYCMTLTLNIRRHGQQFHLYNVSGSFTELAK